MPALRFALAQTNPVVGDIAGNLRQCLDAVREAKAQGATLVAFGEMVLSGYPIEDLATREDFLENCEAELGGFVKDLVTEGLGEVYVVIGHPRLAQKSPERSWAIAQNAASVIYRGQIIGSYAKHHLPNYSVFDEYRNYLPGTEIFVFDCGGHRVGLTICEDIWQPGGSVSQLESENLDLCLVLNGSPFEIDKDDKRLALVKSLAKRLESAVGYVNLVGGQDDLVFDGDSLAVSRSGALAGRSLHFATDLTVFELSEQLSPVTPVSLNRADDLEQVWGALVLGLRDYVSKNQFKSVVLGLSGGIDSAVCAALAVDAIGADRAFGVRLPSEFSSQHSLEDAEQLARNLGLQLSTVSISEIVNQFGEAIAIDGVSFENLQARVRGTILMSLANQHGHLALTTGNKTELAVGYSTIYGDSVGGFAPIKDVEKSLVWQLAKWRNSMAVSSGKIPPIPESSITKPPSAELRPGQLDQDSLPPYDQLDEILDAFIERGMSIQQITALGHSAEIVERVIGLVRASEWKRRQGAIGTKITGMAFGRDRRMPITNRYRNS